MTATPIHICTLCGRHQQEVDCMVKPQPNLLICAECVEELMLAVLSRRHPDIGEVRA